MSADFSERTSLAGPGSGRDALPATKQSSGNFAFFRLSTGKGRKLLKEV
jgi:hypothetical protein